MNSESRVNEEERFNEASEVYDKIFIIPFNIDNQTNLCFFILQF